MDIITRITTGWSIRRLLYLALGIYLIVQSIIDKQWFGVILGTYFASMGFFAFGCAAGNCFGGSCDNNLTNNDAEEVKFEEINNK
jgi:hypothetical protein